ncbi:protein max-like isoform X4 [Atheta coriaria]|uniref:protein max-like isoform X4 n=1 Tax=Dalotia coriaria TaxID=877792 RepID=UPI0031F4568B
MSDDDRDIDVDSDADKRAHHNALERKRRDHIKDSFSSLRDSVPALNGEKASRAQILKKAAEYIQHMRTRNSGHQQDIEDLRRQNILLESQIRKLEKAKSTGTFIDGDLKNEYAESESDTSDMEDSANQKQAKKMKIAYH